VTAFTTLRNAMNLTTIAINYDSTVSKYITTTITSTSKGLRRNRPLSKSLIKKLIKDTDNEE
jgi:hypothetical protein